jgi:hypothetical protein
MALKNAVDFINAFRMISGADNFNGGRDAIKAENSNVSFQDSSNLIDLHHLGFP